MSGDSKIIRRSKFGTSDLAGINEIYNLILCMPFRTITKKEVAQCGIFQILPMLVCISRIDDTILVTFNDTL